MPEKPWSEMTAEEQRAEFDRIAKERADAATRERWQQESAQLRATGTVDGVDDE